MNFSNRRSRLRFNFFSFPAMVIAITAICLLTISGYFLLYLPNSVSATLSNSYQIVETTYSKVHELVSDLDSRYSINSLADSEFERIDQDKNNLKKAQEIVSEAKIKLNSFKEKPDQEYYNASRSFLDVSKNTFDSYELQLDFYKCLFSNINEQSNNWTLVISNYTKINQKNPVDEISKRSVQGIIENLNKNSVSVNNLSSCYKDSKSQYLTPQISKIIADTSSILNKMASGYQTLLNSTLEKDKQSASKMLDQGLEQINSVNSQNLPLLENINQLYAASAKDFGNKEPEINNSFENLKSIHAGFKSKYRL